MEIKGIFKRVNPDANPNNALKITVQDKLCCGDDEITTMDYLIAVDTGGSQPYNEQIDQIAIDGVIHKFSQEIDLTTNTQAVADQVAEEINAILESLGYVGEVSASFDGNDLQVSAENSQAVFNFLGTYQAFQVYKPNYTSVYLPNYLNVPGAPVPAGGATMTIETFDYNGNSVEELVGESAFFVGGSNQPSQDLTTWLNTILGKWFHFEFVTTTIIKFTYNTGIGEVQGAPTDAIPFLLAIRRQDSVENTLHELEITANNPFAVYRENGGGVLITGDPSINPM